MKHTRVWVVGMVAAFAAVPSCSGPTPADDTGGRDASSPPVDTGTTVDTGTRDAGTAVDTLVPAATGGLVESSDGLFRIYVSPGALAEDTRISITRIAAADVPADVAATGPISAVYAVEPDGLTFGGDGAWGYFTFPSVPAGLISSDTPPLYSTVQLHARPAAGGPIEDHEGPHAFYRADGTFLAYGRLSHLSLQWTAPSRRPYQTGRLGVDWPATEHSVGTTFGATALVSAPEEVPHSLTYRTLSTPPIASLSGTGGRDYRWHLPPDGAEVLGFEHDVALAPGSTWPLSPAPTWRCLAAGESTLFISTSLYVLTGSGPQPHTIEVARSSTCVEEPPIEANILDTIACRREDTRVVCGDAPVVVASTRVSPMTTTTVALPDTTFFMASFPAGVPIAVGPTTISATDGAATMTATRDATTGTYTSVIDPAFDVTAAATWTTSGPSGTATTPAPEPAPAFHFGPVGGLDTDIVIDGAAMGDIPDIELELNITARVTCLTVPIEAPVIFGSPEVVDLGDGTFGFDAPARHAIDAAALHCGIPASDLTVAPWTLEVRSSVSEVVPLPMTRVRVRTGSAAHIESAALTATCPAGRTYCTSGCVNLATDPLNCGGCGVVGTEICDGLDNNCNGRIDDGCPATLHMAGAGAVTSPTYGTPVPGHSSSALACPTYYVTAGYRGREVGPIWQLAPYCTGVAMRVDRTSVPYRYFVDATPVMPPGTPWSGSTGGGTGSTFDRPCPTNMMVDGATVQADMNLGTLSARCVQWEIQRDAGGTWQLVRGATTMLPLAGSGTGTSYTWIAPLHSSGTPELINNTVISYAPGTPIEALHFTTITAIFTLIP